jgi:PAS domain S-box-containing protein
MIINTLTIEKEAKSNLLLDDIILREFQNTLIFISETCDFADAFIAVKNGDQYAMQTKIGLPSLLEPYELHPFIKFSQSNEEMIVCESENSSSSSLFFAGFPIVIPDFFIGCICLSANNPKELSVIELYIIKHSVSKLESLLQLERKNSFLQHTKKQNKKKFRMYEENSSETLSQISLEGIITYTSDNLTKSVGYKPVEIIGKHFLHFIHPNDIESYNTYLDTISLNIKNNVAHTYRYLHKEGHYVWRSSRLQLYKKDEKLFYICNCTDITAFVEKEKQLKEQKDFYETILNSTPTDVVAFDINHKYKFLNPAAIKNDELRAFIIDKDDFEYAEHRNRNPAFAIDRREKFNIALKTKKTYSWEEKLIIDDTTTTYHKRTFTPVYRADGSFKIMIGFSIDLTASKKAQQTIFDSRELLRNILNNTAAGILVQGPQSEIIENNVAACKMLGLTQNQLLGKTSFDPLWQVIHEDGTYFKPENHPVPQALRTLKPVNKIIMGVQRPTKKDLVWLLVDAIPVFGKDNELLYVVCSFNDITIQKKAELAIKISNERFKYITEASSDVIWDLDIATNQTYLGNRYTKQFGHKIANKNGLINTSQYFSLVHPEDQQLLSSKLDAELQNPEKKKWSSEYRYLKADGSFSYVKNKAYIVRDKAGKATRLIGAMTDITLEKKLTDKVRQSEEKFKGAFEYSQVGIGLVDKNGFWFDSNKKLCSILGYSKTELQSLTFIDLTHPDDLKRDAVNHKTLDENKKSFFEMEKRYIHKNQRVVWVSLLASSVKDKEGNLLYYLAQIIDITDRKRIEEQNKLLIEENNRNKNMQLNEAKNLYRLLAENTVDLVCLHNLDGVFEYVSPSVKQLLGYKQEDLIGKSPLDFTHPDDLAHLKNGIYKFINEAEDIAAQWRFKTANGNYLWLETKAILVKENGVPVSMQTGTRDITLRREAEEAIKNNLANEIKLNELRTNLVSTISHEFRTPMTTIRASSELIEMYLEGQQIDNLTKIYKHTQTIASEIDRIIDLMNAVLTISKEDSGKTTFKPTTFDLKDMCFDLIDKYYNDNDYLRQIKTNVTGDSFPVFGDKHLMEHTIFNVLNNAFKYSKNETNVVLNLFSKGNNMQLEIIDSGIGIPKKEQLNLFNTFFRASNTYGIQGTGLGLYIVKTFTEKNSGTVQLASELGKGTKVTLTFPVDKKN